MSTQLVVAVPGALAAASSFSASAVLQQRAARRAPEDESLSWRLIFDLVHRGSWLAGMGLNVVGFCFQALALAFAPVALVEPIVGLEIVIALPVAARLRHLHLGRREWLGAACVAGGVAGFLALCQAAGGHAEPPLSSWAVVAGPALAVSAGAIFLARGPEGPRRAALLGLGAGIVFALMALVTQSFVHLIGQFGLTGALQSWQPYVLLTVAPVGFTVGQSAYQSGPLAMSLPVIDSSEPVMAVVFAAIAFGQHISLAQASLAGELVSAAVAVTGIFLLGHSPLVLSIYEQTQREKDRRT